MEEKNSNEKEVNSTNVSENNSDKKATGETKKKGKFKIAIILIAIVLIAFIIFAIISATGVIENDFGKAISNIFNKSDDTKTEVNINNNTNDNTNTTETKEIADENKTETKQMAKPETKPDTPSENTATTKKTYITAGGYTLNFGTYKGQLVQGVWDEETMTSTSKYTDVTLVLTENSITLDGQTAGYTISGNEINWKAFDFNVLQVSGNNKITYLAENCPELVYQGY